MCVRTYRHIVLSRNKSFQNDAYFHLGRIANQSKVLHSVVVLRIMLWYCFVLYWQDRNRKRNPVISTTIAWPHLWPNVCTVADEWRSPRFNSQWDQFGIELFWIGYNLSNQGNELRCSGTHSSWTKKSLELSSLRPDNRCGCVAHY